MTFYCWNCYGRNASDHGACVHCGKEISPPEEATTTERLVWASRHPDPDVAILAVRRLGIETDRSAIPELRALVLRPPDPYVGAEALRSLLKLSDLTVELDFLANLAVDGSLLVRNVARDALRAVPLTPGTDEDAD